MDNFEIGKLLPHCILQAHAPKEENVSDLVMRVNLEGAHEDGNFFSVHIQAQSKYYL